MSNRDELDGFLMLFRAMTGEENVIEHMEAEGQQCAIRNTMMAKKMYPSREDFEQLGFIFEDIPGDEVLCYATLPQGWSMKPTDHSMHTEIIDENGMIRGSMFYKASFYDRSANMSLKCRYRVCSRYVDNDQLITEVYFGNDKERLFVAGQISRLQNANRDEILAYYDKEDKLKEIAKQFANENYPDWESVHAYWGKEKESSKETPKQIVKK